ncbi:MAG: JDVT-CTERM system CAAX-type protease [Nitrospirae bacterium]|nr:JDVT-CTERM system CAAX-type protease [Nitrospirota bacterium]
MRALTEALALHPIRGLWRDRHFVLALLTALPAWALLTALFPGPAGAVTPAALLYRVILAPLVEELAFRGALQGWLLEAGWGRRLLGLSRANLAVSVLFCAAHAAFHPPLWALAVAVPSLVLGHLRERFGSTVPSILVHGWYNGGHLLLSGAP